MKKLLLNLMIITFLTGCSNAFLIATIPIGGAVGTVVGTGVGTVATPVLAVKAMVRKDKIPSYFMPIAAIPVAAIYIPIGAAIGAVKGLGVGVMCGIFPTLAFDELSFSLFTLESLNEE